MKPFNKILLLILSLALTFPFIAADCAKSTEPEKPVSPAPNPPSNVYVVVDAVAGGASFAIVSWDKSPQHDNADFKGYLVVTYRVNQLGDPLSTVDSVFIPKIESRKRVVQNIQRGVRYKSYVYSVNNDGKRSIPFGTVIYAGVYFGEGVIDEFKLTGPARSGYGWNASTGTGSQYSFAQSNYPNIDLHMRLDSASNVLTFYSPNVKAAFPGARVTRFAVVSKTGQSGFDLVEGLEEPTLAAVSVVKDNVYLLKTQDSIYVKVWVKNIKTTGSGADAYRTAEFEYKIQPITNLRVVKK
ncbi:MAG: hypothetical protein N3F03_03970 [Ignavibacteria bacterium]|nr:hypothetical protein [Ignavibacteria bacterium]